MSDSQKSVPTVPLVPTGSHYLSVSNGTDETPSLKELAARVINQHQEVLAKIKKYSSTVPVIEHGTQEAIGILGTDRTVGTVPTEHARLYIMCMMTEWCERAAMMTCGDLTVEQAEMSAWHDLKLDDVFWGSRVLQ